MEGQAQNLLRTNFFSLPILGGREWKEAIVD